MSIQWKHPGLSVPKSSKYRNTKCVWKGEKFDSKRELERHLVLLDMQKRAEIEGLRRQPKYPLIVNGKQIAIYIADWEYWHHSGLIAEDAKGFRTKDYILKKKLFCALFPHIEHRES